MALGDGEESGYPSYVPPASYMPEPYVPHSSYALPPSYAEAVHPVPEMHEYEIEETASSTSSVVETIEIPVQQTVTHQEVTQTTIHSSDKQNSNGVILFHIFSIVLCLLSILLTPLIEIIPMIWALVISADLTNRGTKSEKVGTLAIIDIAVTVCVMLLWAIVIIICAVPTYGLCLILLVLLIPYVLVISYCATGMNAL